MIEGTPVEFVRMVPTLRGAADRSPYAKRCAARRVHGGVALCSPRNSTFDVVVPAARAAQLADEIERLFGYECPVCHAHDEHRVRCMRCEQRGFMLSSTTVVCASSHRVCGGCQREIDRNVCHCGESPDGPSHYGEGSHAFVPSGCSCYLRRRAEVRRVTASAADGGLLAERARRCSRCGERTRALFALLRGAPCKAAQDDPEWLCARCYSGAVEAVLGAVADEGDRGGVE